MDTAAELGRNPVSKHQIQPEYGDEHAAAGRDCQEAKFSGTNADREIFICPVQLTTSRIGNLTRLIHTLLYVMAIHTYIHTYIHTNIIISAEVVRQFDSSGNRICTCCGLLFLTFSVLVANPKNYFTRWPIPLVVC